MDARAGAATRPQRIYPPQPRQRHQMLWIACRPQCLLCRAGGSGPRSPPAAPHDPFTVRIIDHEHQVVCFGNCIDLIQGGKITIHAENTVGDDQSPAVAALIGLDSLFQPGRVGMRVAYDTGARQARAVDDAGMVQFVRKDHIFFAYQGWNCRQIGRKARLKSDGCFNALKLRQPAFQFQVQVHRSGDGADGSRSNPAAFDAC
jgi:hypothetical protein